RLRDLDYAGQRIMIWMHNYHLSADHPGALDGELTGIKTFGTELRAEGGDDYAPIALVGYDVGINWPGVGTGPQPRPHATSVAAPLHGLGAPFLAVDTRSDFVGGAPVLLNDTGMIAAQQFRALVYLDHSPGMNAVFW